VDEIIARDIFTGEPTRLRWKDGTIQSIEKVRSAPPDLWLAPPLLDLQVNGYAGVDFQQDKLTAKDLVRAVAGLRESGCTRFLLTLITDQWDRMLARLKNLRKLRSASPLLQRVIVGWHIEGPFLSSEPGFCGAHDPALMLDPKIEQIDELRNLTGDEPLLITIAPERLDAIPAIAHAVSLGVKVSVGHTNARRKRLVQAHKAGATGFTHLGNGCPRDLDRHDNILWRMFETSGFKVSLIPDTIHVSPALFRLIHKTIGSENIFYVTDAMSAAGAGPGKYKLGRLELEVGIDQIVRLPGSPNFAGSALEPIDAILRSAEMLDCSWRETWRNYSEIPAAFMGLDHDLRPNSPADFCLIEFAEPNQIITLKTYAAGSLD
jgi:N-acetylglucosamine-6-phosphate deacetylase